MLLKRIIILQFSVLPCWWEFLHRTGLLLGVFFHLFSLYGVPFCIYYSFSAKNPAIIVPASRHVSWDENNYPSILLISGLDFMKWTQIQMLLLLYRQTRVGALAGILLVWQLVWVIYLYLLSKVQILDIYSMPPLQKMPNNFPFTKNISIWL